MHHVRRGSFQKRISVNTLTPRCASYIAGNCGYHYDSNVFPLPVHMKPTRPKISAATRIPTTCLGLSPVSYAMLWPLLPVHGQCIIASDLFLGSLARQL
jgi:hypothetical protein